MAQTNPTTNASPNDSMTVAMTQIIDDRAKRMFEVRDGVLDPGNVKAVHDMRVASRRLRTVLELGAPCFAHKPCRRVVGTVRGLTRALGERRDLDVQLELLTPLAQEAAIADRHGIEALIADRSRLRDEAQAAIPGALAMLDDPLFLDDLANLVATPAPRPAKVKKDASLKKIDPSAPMRENAQLMLDERRRKLTKAADKAVASGESSDLHATRIAAKHLRYTIHAVGFCFGEQLTEAHARARLIQNILGELHDCDILSVVVDAAIAGARSEDAAALVAAAPPGPERLPWSALRIAPHRHDYAGLVQLSVLLAARREAARLQFGDLWVSSR